MSKVKRCRKGHTKTGTRCLKCKALNEKQRYWADPERERARKKRAYRGKKSVHAPHKNGKQRPAMTLRKTHIIDGDRMTQTKPACNHENATQLDEFPGIFYCTDEDVFFDLDMNIVPNPYESGGAQSGKAQAPATTGATKSPSAPANPKPGQKRKYTRDESLMVSIQCSQQGCKRSFLMWPQNVKPEGNYCPEEHRPLQRLAQAAARQKAFRERNKA